MPEMILYLLKVNAALLLFYAGYHFILRRYTFHTLNRFYLLVGLVYSALYPLIDVSNILNRNQQLKEKINLLASDWQGSVTYAVNQAEDQAGNSWQIVLMIFWTGVLCMSLRLLVQLVSLLSLHLQSSSVKTGNIEFRKIPKAVNPFSFWRTIYLNPECHDASELRSILEHEQVHVKQLHTVDVILAELSTIFYWFNPGVWLMKKAIKANLEFITDQEVIRSGIDSREYQYALLKSQVLPQNSMPINNFHFLTIKKRIAMINKKPSNRITLGGYLLMLPAIMILTLMVSTSNAALSKKTVSEVITDLPSISELPEILSHSRSKNPEAIKSSNGLNVITNLNTLVEESVQSLVKVTKTDTTKSKTVTIRVQGTGDASGNAIGIVTTLAGKNDTLQKIKSEPIYILNGERMTKSFGSLNADSIAAVNVYKGQGATTIYGAEGRNGVVEITTKSYVSSKSGTGRVTVAGYGQNEKISLGDIDKRLIILDGKEITKTDLDQIKVTTIGSIEITKGSSATTKYGEKAKAGVIVITTKK